MSIRFVFHACLVSISLGYFLGESVSNFSEAEAVCSSHKSHLSSLHSFGDFTDVLKTCKINSCYVGIHQNSTLNWINVDGTAIDYGFNLDGIPSFGVIPWSYNQSNYTNNTHCVQIQHDTLYIVPCDSNGYPLCNSLILSTNTWSDYVWKKYEIQLIVAITAYFCIICLCLFIILRNKEQTNNENEKDIDAQNNTDYMSMEEMDDIDEEKQSLDIEMDNTKGYDDEYEATEINDELQIWLESLGLSQYRSNFVFHGYESLDFIKDIDDISELIEIDINDTSDQYKLMTAIKGINELKKRIEEYKKNEEIKVMNSNNVNAIKNWLQSVDLIQYLDDFVSNGYQTLDSIKDINSTKQLIDIGVLNEEHQDKLLRAKYTFEEQLTIIKRIAHCVENGYQNTLLTKMYKMKQFNEPGNNDTKELQNWLHTLKMTQYLFNFAENGYRSLDFVKEINDVNALLEIGITLKGHQKKLMNAIRKMNIMENEGNNEGEGVEGYTETFI